jgi:glycosyltransferase involved in cell wall biosynthesis
VTFLHSKQRLKISLVVSDLSKSGAGRWGGAVRPFLLAQALRRLDCEVKIIGFTSNDDPKLDSSSDLPIVSVIGENYPRFFHSAASLLSHVDGDIIYAYKPKPSSFGISLLHKLRIRKPLILDIDDWELSWYGGDHWQYRPTPKQFARDILKRNGELRKPDHPLYLQWMEKLVSHADAVTLHTQFLKNRFGGVYVPNGKDVSLFDPSRYDASAIKQHYNLSEYQVLMFPGAPRPYKGLEDVLIALDKLNQPNLKLVIVGGSPYDDYDNELIKKWSRWIIKLPKTPYNKMPEIIAAADIVVVPQKDTPAAQAQFPLKLTDGMAMAKPILATRVGDIPNILGDSGYMVDPESPEQLVTAIQGILQNPEDAIVKGGKARARCVKHYSIDAMATTLSDVLKSCL